ncbi:hypothetical protein [Desertibacillus haloalkaliphilus]|uniref:hypothetical protein n=1 Tax=Desertibacillus haloalkaliphilus TaxID=1328930 RepID=UPI001C258F98|nr:hypothetical protein [Desertibacillus haloalkaliphilus]MBU8906009.1 hypothetical protein [Desertibacillus haloalkaliphilus]
MSIGNDYGFCAACGNVKEDQSSSLCNQCSLAEYATIKEYIRKNPHANAMDIANHTGISIDRIVRHIKGGAFTYSKR